MKYKVTSDKLRWPAGTIVDADELAGSNIGVLINASHLVEVDDTPEPEPQEETLEEQ